MRINYVRGAAVLLSIIATLLGSGREAQSSIFDILVNTTSDVADFGGAQQVADLPGADGLISLREAIVAANNTAGPQAIGFNIPTSDVGFDGTVFTLKPQSSLPSLIDHATAIDGGTQALFTGETNPLGPEIVLDGSQAGSSSGLIFRANDSAIRGLVIHSFEGAAIQFGFDPGNPAAPSNNKIAQCYLGTDETGSIVKGNGFQGVAVNGSGNVIGGSGADEGNLISGNTIAGIGLGGERNTIAGNLIGTDRTGTLALGNAGFGILTDGSNNVIGGATGAARNIISGNTDNGLAITGNGNRVEGNFIGTDITGNNPLGNGTQGGGLGIQIVFNATGNVIVRNRIAFNSSDGITVGFSATRSTISGNSIFSNAGLAIDLGNGGADDFHGDGVTLNDPGDADAGPNHLMNFPVLISAHATPGRLVVYGEMDTPNPESASIEFFANSVPVPGGDPSGHGEGELFLGTAKPNPRGRFTAHLPPVPVGTLISATATDADGNTSELAANIVATRRPR